MPEPRTDTTPRSVHFTVEGIRADTAQWETGRAVAIRNGIPLGLPYVWRTQRSAWARQALRRSIAAHGEPHDDEPDEDEPADLADASAESLDGIELLAAIRDAFGADASLHTGSLLDRLHDISGPQWAGLTPTLLAKVLRPLGVRPRRIRIGSGPAHRGYRWADVDAAWRHVREEDGMTISP